MSIVCSNMEWMLSHVTDPLISVDDSCCCYCCCCSVGACLLTTTDIPLIDKIYYTNDSSLSASRVLLLQDALCMYIVKYFTMIIMLEHVFSPYFGIWIYFLPSAYLPRKPHLSFVFSLCIFVYYIYILSLGLQSLSLIQYIL